MSKNAFILTAGYHVFDDVFMPIVIAMRESKEDILSLHHIYSKQGKLTNIKAINLNHYTLEISLGNAHAPIIPFKTIYPTAQIRVIQFKEAFLFKQCAGIGLGIDAEQRGKKWLN